MPRNWIDGSAPFLSAANLNAMEGDITSALGVPDGALASRINDTASSSRAALNATYAPASLKTSKVDLAAKRRGLLPPDPGTARLLPLPTVMTSPPTVTVGAANAGTTITGAIRHDGTDPAITYLSAGYTDPGSQGGYMNCKASSNLTSSQPAAGRMRFEFETDADQFEVAVITTASGTNPMYRFWVDGQLATATPQTGLTSGAAVYFVKVAFGARGNRRILFEGAYVNLIGIWAAPTVTFWPSTRPAGPTVLWVGDSFSEGTGANWWWDSWAMKAGQMLGWNVYPSGVGSTGYLAIGGGGGKVKYRDRIATDVTALNPDIVVVTGGYNDTGSFTAAQEGTEADALYAAIKTGNPNATLLVCSIQSPIGVTATGTITQFRDAQKTSTLNAAATFIDAINYPTGTSWVTGSGKTGSRTVTDGATTSSSTTITSATAAFVAGDVGTIITGGSIPVGATIASVTNGTTAVLSAAPTATATAVPFTITAQKGNGNADFYDWTDGVHPSQAGHDYMGRRFASALAAQL